MRPDLTIGMATYQDFNGVYFTLQSLRLHHDCRGVEFIVVDNAPHASDGETIRQFLPWIKDIPVRYVPLTESTGTAAPRDRIFREAQGEAVLCLDSHVLLQPGSLESLRQYFRDNPESQNLVQGPMLMDDLANYCTHFDDVWRGEMWGTWGTDPRGMSPDAPAFEIPAMGLGAFACRKSAWLGFNPKFRGFGGEEWYIHEKYRRAGHRTMCLPGFRWLHRFGRPGGVPYPLSWMDKVRNYAIGLEELGISLDRCRQHFVVEMGHSAAEFDAAASGQPLPPPQVQAQKPSGCGVCRNAQAAPAGTSTPHPAMSDPAIDIIKGYARDARTAAYYADSMGAAGFALTMEVRESLLACSVDTRTEGTAKKPRGDGTHLAIEIRTRSVANAEPRECELLVIDQAIQVDDYYNALAAHAKSCSARILLGGTATRAEVYQDGPGILPAARKFLSNYPQWTVLQHHRIGAGWLVLTRLQSDKKPLPNLLQQGWNFLGALTRKVADGFGEAPQEVIEARLSECSMCPSRNNDRCGECGCPIEKKASWPKEFCPIGRWNSHGE